MSGSQAHVILSRAEVKPHLTDYWIMSDFSQPEFEERLGEICGLYVDPPENVLVVSFDRRRESRPRLPPSRTSSQPMGARSGASTNTPATARSAYSRA